MRLGWNGNRFQCQVQLNSLTVLLGETGHQPWGEGAPWLWCTASRRPLGLPPSSPPDWPFLPSSSSAARALGVLVRRTVERQRWPSDTEDSLLCKRGHSHDVLRFYCNFTSSKGVTSLEGNLLFPSNKALSPSSPLKSLRTVCCYICVCWWFEC